MRPKMELIRLVYTDKGTPGVLKLNGEFVCYTLERPWLNNEQNVSCIPEGNYKGRFQASGSFPDMRMYFQDIPDRSSVMFHWGNYVHNSKGCPLLGESVNTSGDMFIANTKSTVLKVEQLVGGMLAGYRRGAWDIHVTSL